MLNDVRLCVKYVVTHRLQSARVLVRRQREAGIGFDEGFKFQFGDASGLVLPIVIEVGPWGIFCLDGSHRIKALFECGIEFISVLAVSPTDGMPPPAKLYDLSDVVISESCPDWRERFVNFDESLFRPVAALMDRLSIRMEKE